MPRRLEEIEQRQQPVGAAAGQVLQRPLEHPLGDDRVHLLDGHAGAAGGDAGAAPARPRRLLVAAQRSCAFRNSHSTRQLTGACSGRLNASVRARRHQRPHRRCR